MAMTLDQLRQLAADHGFPDPNLAAAVAMAESGGNPNAKGDPQFGGSYGLWQINHPAHPGYDVDSLLDRDYNADAAYQVSSGGTNWHPWSTFNSQGGDPPAYLKYYDPGAAVPNSLFTSRTMKNIAVIGGILLVSGFIASRISPGIASTPAKTLRRRLHLP